MSDTPFVIPRGDKPRKVIVCNPADAQRIQKALVELRYGDVLVKPNELVDLGRVMVIDGSSLDLQEDR